jgi:hypothetical protein
MRFENDSYFRCWSLFMEDYQHPEGYLKTFKIQIYDCRLMDLCRAEVKGLADEGKVISQEKVVKAVVKNCDKLIFFTVRLSNRHLLNNNGF